MILLGLAATEKAATIQDLAARRDLKRIIICSPSKFDFDLPDPGCPVQWVDWPEIIMYRTFYPLLQTIDARTLVVVNECLRTQKRNDLTYNCIRHYLAQAGHVLVLQWLPCIDTMTDFMALYDFATGSRWRREPFDIDPPEPVPMRVTERTPSFSIATVAAPEKVRDTYTAKRADLFAKLGSRDPHTLPRNLHLVGAKTRAAHRPASGRALVRGSADDAETYKAVSYPAAPYTIIDWPHNFIDLADVSALSGQTEFDVITTDLPVDRWYVDRYVQWSQRIRDGYRSLRSWAQCP